MKKLILLLLLIPNLVMSQDILNLTLVCNGTMNSTLVNDRDYAKTKVFTFENNYWIDPQYFFYKSQGDKEMMEFIKKSPTYKRKIDIGDISIKHLSDIEGRKVFFNINRHTGDIIMEESTTMQYTGDLLYKARFEGRCEITNGSKF